MDGSAKTIFDSLFGSFDEFEKRYPLIVKGLRALIGAAGGAKDAVDNAAGVGEGESLFTYKDIIRGLPVIGPLYGALKAPGEIGDLTGNNMNPLDGLNSFLGLFMDSDKANGLSPGLTPPSVNGGKQTNITNTNSGNTTITVATPEEAAAVANARDASFANQMTTGLDNMAEGGGYA
ncbi:Uncharacterised protein [Enterobacter cancerogenus]|uniref:Uncharacterized protein n=1 Tax=Enterobacter cancerogenus TaxID=69218 RepID=A0A484XQK6_9ENTR|nr:Uncharacterised protein [Enterobacter cancerogenus]